MGGPLVEGTRGKQWENTFNQVTKNSLLSLVNNNRVLQEIKPTSVQYNLNNAYNNCDNYWFMWQHEGNTRLSQDPKGFSLKSDKNPFDFS